MLEYPHALQIRGRYQLVALTYSPVYSPADVFGHAVLTTEGARVTEVLTLDAAQRQLSSLLEQDGAVQGMEQVVDEKRPLPRRRRRQS